MRRLHLRVWPEVRRGRDQPSRRRRIAARFHLHAALNIKLAGDIATRIEDDVQAAFPLKAGVELIE
jgi:hypothetical protein